MVSPQTDAAAGEAELLEKLYADLRLLADRELINSHRK
jgi:hypothetical protein